MRLIAVREFSFNAGSRTLHPGERFEASKHDARLLIGWGKAIEDPAASVPIMSASLAADAAPVPAKRRYRRRDMAAESS